LRSAIIAATELAFAASVAFVASARPRTAELASVRTSNFAAEAIQN
jgi:hypothetical protein